MRRNSPVKDGFRPRPNYVRKISRTGKVFNWCRDPVGRYLKITICFIGQTIAPEGTVNLERDFSAQGITPDALFSQLTARAPWAAGYYFARRGVELTPDIVFDRFHKMHYINRKGDQPGRPGISGEHIVNCDFLRPRVGKVDALFRKGTAVTLEEAATAGA